MVTANPVERVIQLLEAFVEQGNTSLAAAKQLEGAIAESFAADHELQDLADLLAQYRPGGGGGLYAEADVVPQAAVWLRRLRSDSAVAGMRAVRPEASVAVQIVRWVDESFPGFVECVLVDAAGMEHRFVDKVPVVSLDDLQPTSCFPCEGTIGCEVEAAWKDAAGRSVARISTERPWGVASTTGRTRFVVLSSQVVQSTCGDR